MTRQYRAYRAPELLFGSRTYDALAIDLWAIGAVLAEMFEIRLPTDTDGDSGSDSESNCDQDPLEKREAPSRRTLFDSTYGDLGLAASIFRLRGTPTTETWPVRPSYPLAISHADPLLQEFRDLPDAGKVHFDAFPSVPLGSVIDALPNAVNLIERLITLSPSKRLKAREAVDHPLFLEAVVTPRGMKAWHGDGANRREVAPQRIAEEVDGLTLVDVFQPWLNEARERYAKLEDQERYR